MEEGPSPAAPSRKEVRLPLEVREESCPWWVRLHGPYRQGDTEEVSRRLTNNNPTLNLKCSRLTRRSTVNNSLAPLSNPPVRKNAASTNEYVKYLSLFTSLFHYHSGTSLLLLNNQWKRAMLPPHRSTEEAQFRSLLNFCLNWKLSPISV